MSVHSRRSRRSRPRQLTMTPARPAVLDPSRLGTLLRRHGLWLMLPPLVLATVAFLVSDAQPRRYEAKAALVYQPTRAEQLLGADRDDDVVQRTMKTDEQLLTGPAYQEQFESTFGGNFDVDADALDGTDVLEIAVVAPTPAAAATIANTVADNHVAQRRSQARDELTTARAAVAGTVEELELELADVADELLSLQPTPPPAEDTSPTTMSSATQARIADLERRQATLDDELVAARAALREIDTGAVLTNGDVSVAGPAVEPSDPIAPQPTRSATLGAMLGVLLGLGLVWLRETGDRRLYSTDDVLEVDGAVEFAGRVPKPAELPPTGPASLLVAEIADSFKIMASNSLARDGAPAAVHITGARGGEGATYVAINTAVTLALGGWRTALVDADLADGDIHGILGVDQGPGTSDVLAGEPLSAATQASRLVPGLHVIARGLSATDDTVLKTSLPKMINALRARFDAVIIDGPPVLVRGDAAVLGSHVDRTILVAEAGRSTGPDVRTAIDIVAMGGGRISGLVLTDTIRAQPTIDQSTVPTAEHDLRPRPRLEDTLVSNGSQPTIPPLPATPSEVTLPVGGNGADSHRVDSHGSESPEGTPPPLRPIDLPEPPPLVETDRRALDRPPFST